MCRYVEWKTGKLEHAFISVEEKSLHGAKGIKRCFQQSLARLYPDYVDVTPDNIFSLMKENQFVDTSRISAAAAASTIISDDAVMSSASNEFLTGLDDF